MNCSSSAEWPRWSVVGSSRIATAACAASWMQTETGLMTARKLRRNQRSERMNSQQEQFLNLKTHPARLKVEEAAWYLGFAAHEITILMSEGLLKPLGHPPP